MTSTSPNQAERTWPAVPAPPQRPRARVSTALLLPLVLFVLSLAINLVHVDITEFHSDESRWINRANYASDLLNPFGPTWKDQYLTRGQPPLGSYLMGLGLLLQGRDTDTNAVWDFSYGPDWNRTVGAMASGADLDAARRANAVVGALTVVLVYFIGRTLMGTIAGVAGGLMLALHPLHIWISSQALSDQLLVFLVAASMLVAIRLGNSPSRGSALALGVLLGLGGATKLSPLLLALPVALFGLAMLVLARYGQMHPAKSRRLGVYLLWQPVIAFTTFVSVYPYLWPAPIQRTLNLFALRSSEMDNQSAAWPDVAVDNPILAIGRIYERLTVQFSTTGSLLGDAAGWLGFGSEPWGIDIPIAVFGTGVLTMLVFKRSLTSGTALATFLLAAQVAAIVVGMQVDFYRYHLPVVLAVAILSGLTVQAAWQFVAARAGSPLHCDDATASTASTSNHGLRTGGNR